MQSTGASSADVVSAAMRTRGRTSSELAGRPDRDGRARGADSTHVPTLIGEVGLNTRSMLRKRLGRPRSAIRSGGLTAMPANASSEQLRASARLPLARAASPSRDDPPASPPAKKYQPMKGFQTCGLRIGRP